MGGRRRVLAAPFLSEDAVTDDLQSLRGGEISSLSQVGFQVSLVSPRRYQVWILSNNLVPKEGEDIWMGCVLPDPRFPKDSLCSTVH